MINVPKMAELTVKRLFDDAKSDPLISVYLPEGTPKQLISRDFFFNVSACRSGEHSPPFTAKLTPFCR